MKKIIFKTTLFVLVFTIHLKAQTFNDIVFFSTSTTPVNGVKIKTNLPYVNSTQMPTITITGYSYGHNAPINLTLVYYIYNGSFHNPRISSFGDYTPSVLLSNENGKVIIFINDKCYFQRFKVSAFAHGLGNNPTYFQGWTAVDEPLSGTNTMEAVYENRFKRLVNVDGLLRAKEIKVETGWADFVFDKDYRLPSLAEVERHIRKKGHLQGIPTEEEVKTNGINLGEINMKLLQKIEELTLYIIENDKNDKEKDEIIRQLLHRIEKLEKKQ
ncbi:Hypothetical protein PEIBARAKI_6991 [Petrimonas sp. IBARAKI]|nr:Hypothetical protein PEIBARAKI_6991 [Petrimonas sp. IBARAKI]